MADEFATLVMQLKTSPLEEGLDRSQRKLDDFGGKAERSLTSLKESSGKAFGEISKAIAGAFGAYAITNFAKSSILAFSDLNETASKFGVVFSSVIGRANAAARELQQSYGQSAQGAMNLLSATGDLLTGFGFTRDQALDLSIQVAKLGTDLASFSNYAGGSEGASFALTKAMLGETEQAKMLGIAIKTDSDEYKTIYNEIKQATGMTDTQVKALTALRIATEQSKNAIGDFGRTSDGFANQMRIASQNMVDFKSAIGAELGDAANLALHGVNALLRGFNELNRDMDGYPAKVVTVTAGYLALQGGLVAVGKVTTLYNAIVGQSAAAMAADTAATTANTAAHAANAATRGAGGIADVSSFGASISRNREKGKIISRGISTEGLFGGSDKYRALFDNYSATGADRRFRNGMQIYGDDMFAAPFKGNASLSAELRHAGSSPIPGAHRIANAFYSKTTTAGNLTNWDKNIASAFSAFSGSTAGKALSLGGTSAHGVLGLNTALDKFGKTVTPLSGVTGLLTSKLSSFKDVASMAGVAFAGVQVAMAGLAIGKGISRTFNFWGEKDLERAQADSDKINADVDKKLADLKKRRAEEGRSIATPESTQALKDAQYAYGSATMEFNLGGIASHDFAAKLGVLRDRVVAINAQYASIKGQDAEAQIKRLELDKEAQGVLGKIRDTEKESVAYARERNAAMFERQFSAIGDLDTSGQEWRVQEKQLKALKDRIASETATLSTLTGDAYEKAKLNLESLQDRAARLKADVERRKIADEAAWTQHRLKTTEDMRGMVFDLDYESAGLSGNRSGQRGMLQDRFKDATRKLNNAEVTSQFDDMLKQAGEMRTLRGRMAELAKSSFTPTRREASISQGVERGSAEDQRLRSMVDTRSDNTDAKRAADAAAEMQKQLEALSTKLVSLISSGKLKVTLGDLAKI